MPGTDPSTNPASGLASALDDALGQLPVRDGVVLDLDGAGAQLLSGVVGAGFVRHTVSVDDIEAVMAAAPAAGPKRVVAVLVADGALPTEPAFVFERLAAVLSAASAVVLITVLESYTLLDGLAASVNGQGPPRTTTADVHAMALSAGFSPICAADDVERRAMSGPASSGLDALVSARTGPGWAGGHVRIWSRSSVAAPFLTAIVRTQGRRMDHLREVLLCLAAQTDPDFDVVVVAHDPVANAATAIDDLLDEHAAAFRSRVRIWVCRGGDRGRPLNVGLAHATGRYVACIDDDDLVTADWVEGFRLGATTAGHEGSIVRSATARQNVRSAAPDHLGPYEVVSGFQTPYSPTFSLHDHLVDNQSPICSLGFPRQALDAWGIRFDENLSAHEDWDVLLRLAGAVGVIDTCLVTSIYHWWVDGAGSAGVVDNLGWGRSAAAVRRRFEHSGFVAQPSQLADLIGAASASQALAAELADASGKLATLEKFPGWDVATKVAKGAISARREVRRRVALRREHPG